MLKQNICYRPICTTTEYIWVLWPTNDLNEKKYYEHYVSTIYQDQRSRKVVDFVSFKGFFIKKNSTFYFINVLIKQKSIHKKVIIMTIFSKMPHTSTVLFGIYSFKYGKISFPVNKLGWMKYYFYKSRIFRVKTDTDDFNGSKSILSSHHTTHQSEFKVLFMMYKNTSFLWMIENLNLSENFQVPLGFVL